MCHTERPRKTLGWEREGKVPHHSLAKPELSPGALGLCPSWEALVRLRAGPVLSPFWGLVAAQACWVGDSHRLCLLVQAACGDDEVTA